MKLTEEQLKEIKDQQAQQIQQSCYQIRKILFEAIPILDHGFIRVVDYMGDDTSIVQMQVSYGKKKKVSTDQVLKYLMRYWLVLFNNNKISCEVAIFIARQWIRHRTPM